MESEYFLSFEYFLRSFTLFCFFAPEALLSSGTGAKPMRSVWGNSQFCLILFYFLSGTMQELQGMLPHPPSKNPVPSSPRLLCIWTTETLDRGQQTLALRTDEHRSKKGLSKTSALPMDREANPLIISTGLLLFDHQSSDHRNIAVRQKPKQLCKLRKSSPHIPHASSTVHTSYITNETLQKKPHLRTIIPQVPLPKKYIFKKRKCSRISPAPTPPPIQLLHLFRGKSTLAIELRILNFPK